MRHEIQQSTEQGERGEEQGNGGNVFPDDKNLGMINALNEKGIDV